MVQICPNGRLPRDAAAAHGLRRSAKAEVAQLLNMNVAGSSRFELVAFSAELPGVFAHDANGLLAETFCGRVHF